VSQFGREGRQGWQLAAGWIDDPVTGYNTPDPITLKMDFPIPLTDRLMVIQALERLIEQALWHPRRIGHRVQSVRVEAILERGTSWMAKAAFKDPSADPGGILEPFVVRLEHAPPNGAVEQLMIEFTVLVPGTSELQLFARDAASAARAGRRRALRAAVDEIRTRFTRPLLYRVIKAHQWSRIPERRYALIDFDL
jgi:hypothetical protein